MSAPRMTRAEVHDLIAEIHAAAAAARRIDPATRGRVSYPAMCGGLESILRNVVRRSAGGEAAARVAAAFDAEWRADVERSSDLIGGFAAA